MLSSTGARTSTRRRRASCHRSARIRMSCAISMTYSSICGRAPMTPFRVGDRKSTKTNPRRRPKWKTAASDKGAERQAETWRDKHFQHQEPAGIDPRASAAGLQRKRLHAWLKFSNERRLLQERREGTACGALELLGVNRAIIVGIGSLEAFLDERKKFILVQSSVAVGVGGGEILCLEPAAQFASVEGAIVVAVELVEQLRSCTLRFGEIDRAVIIRVECFDQALRPRWRGADQRNRESNQYGLSSDAHVHVL